MKKKLSKLAVITFGIGGTTALFSFIRAAVLLVVAIPLGPAAVCSGTLAVWLIRRRPGSLRGTGLAIWGACLGIFGTLLSIAVLAGMFAGQFDQDRWRQEQAEQLQRTVARGGSPSGPVSKFTSNLPIIVLRTHGQQLSKHGEVLADAEFFDLQGEDRRASLQAKPDHAGLLTVHLHGTSSLQLPKKTYTFHTVDSQTNQTKVALLGLAKEEDWILYAAFEDKTMIRDVLAYELSNRMGQYAQRTRFVELFVDDSNGALSMRDYAGVYVLMEKIKRSKDRVNIAKLEPKHIEEPEISGGYIVKRDHGEGSGKRFRTEHGGPYFFVYPNPREITAQQRSWLANYFNAFESALYSPDFADPKAGYAAYLDVDAFIDAHWLVELSKNVDGFRYSAYLTKDRGGKLKPGPAWDWNRSFGNANYYGGWQTQGWYSNNLRPNEISWYHRLREDPAFARRCAARWKALRRDVLDPQKINALIDQYAAQLEEAQQRNFKRWPILGQQVTCNHYVGATYNDEVRWLKNWITRRIAWIDSKVNGQSIPEDDSDDSSDDDSEGGRRRRN